jgi:hypothetical protein
MAYVFIKEKSSARWQRSVSSAAGRNKSYTTRLLLGEEKNVSH